MAIALSGRLDFNPITDTITNEDNKEIMLLPPNGDELPKNGFSVEENGYVNPPEDGSDIEIIVNPSSKLSMQRHKYRSEHWVVVGGKIFVNSINSSTDLERVNSLVSGQSTYIPKNISHQIENPTTNMPAKIIEIWIGEDLREEDIERK